MTKFLQRREISYISTPALAHVEGLRVRIYKRNAGSACHEKYSVCAKCTQYIVNTNVSKPPVYTYSLRKNYISMYSNTQELHFSIYSNPSAYPTSFDLPHAAWRAHARGVALQGHDPLQVACCSDRRKWNCTKQSRCGSCADSLAEMLFAMAFLVVS